jgi:hypothetical protein
MYHGDLIAVLREHSDRPRTAVKQSLIFERRTT